MITLVNVNDAYSVTVTPSTCAIKADFDGTNPILDEAYCDMSVVRGNIKVPFTITSHIPSNTGIKYSFSGSEYVRRMRLTAIPSDVLSGNITMDVATKDEYVAQVIFQYSVIREATMLDWIKDWEGGKTKIGGTYIMTPKIFIGRKSQYQQYEGVANSLADIDNLTGVYIGPNSASTGIYGYKNSNEIFHINESGGMIGGWSIENGGIQSEDGNLKLLAEGSIEVRNAKQDVVWGIYSNGSAKFAKGNVIFNNDGSAYFAGKISATSGKIGGFSISSEALSTDGIAIDGTNKVIAVYNGPVVVGVSNNLNMQTDYYTTVKRQSGVMMYYNNANDYGLAGYVSAKLAFSVGAENKIAGWNFDETAIYTGVRNNTLTGYTTEGITIGTNGLRGLHFYIDSTGAVSFADGKFTVAKNGDTQISGWSLFANRLSTNYAAIVSDSNLAGLFLSASDIAETATTGLLNTIQKTGGIYLMRDSAQASLSAYGNDGTLFFRLSNTKTNVIAGWNFYGSALYKGTLKDVSGQFTTASGDITIGETGIRGFRWQLNADGSGSVGGGHFSWDKDGNVTLDDSVQLSASSIVSGTLDATNISSDTIISNGNAWALNKDGSGYLANKNIIWDKDGSLKITGTITAGDGKIGPFKIGSDGIYTGDYSKWFSREKSNFCYLNSSSLLLEQQVGYFKPGDIASLKVGLGRGSDPTTKGYKDGYCASAMYIYRQMNSALSFYEPAIKVISDNIINRNISARFVGGVQVHGGLMNVGSCMEYTSIDSSSNAIDLSFGTTVLLYDAVGAQKSDKTLYYTTFFFPTLSALRKQLGITDTSRSFTVIVTLIARKDSKTFMVATQKSKQGDAEGGSIINNNGNEWASSHPQMGAGDCHIYALCYTPTTGYYVQLVSSQI